MLVKGVTTVMMETEMTESRWMKQWSVLSSEPVCVCVWSWRSVCSVAVVVCGVGCHCEHVVDRGH